MLLYFLILKIRFFDNKIINNNYENKINNKI